MCSSFFETILEMGWRALGVFGGLHCPLLDQPSAIGPYLFLDLTPAIALQCVVLISKSQNCLSGKVLPCLHIGPIPSYIPFFLACLHSTFLPTALGCFHGYPVIVAVHVRVSPLSSGLPKQLFVLKALYSFVKLFQPIKDRKHLKNCNFSETIWYNCNSIKISDFVY